eukprot:gene17218-biopygen2934
MQYGSKLVRIEKLSGRTRPDEERPAGIFGFRLTVVVPKERPRVAPPHPSVKTEGPGAVGSRGAGSEVPLRDPSPHVVRLRGADGRLTQAQKVISFAEQPSRLMALRCDSEG